LIISGVVSNFNINDSSLILNNKIYCSFLKRFDESSLKLGDTVLIKGRYVGFDDLFRQATLDNCTLGQ